MALEFLRFWYATKVMVDQQLLSLWDQTSVDEITKTA